MGKLGTILLLISVPIMLVSQQSLETGKMLSQINSINIDFNLAPISEQDLIEQALQNSRKMHNLNTNATIAEYEMQSSGKWSNPELRIADISSRYLTEEFDELRAGVRFRFPTLGESAEEKQAANVDYWKRKVEEIRYHQELIARIRKNCAEVIMYDQLAELAIKNVAIEEERIKVVEDMFQIGRRPVAYFTKAKMAYAEAISDHARAIQNQLQARRKLAKRTDMDVRAPVTTAVLPDVTIDLDQLIEIAYKNRPEISLVDQRIELAYYRNRLERMKAVPWFSFIEWDYHVDSRINHSDWSELRLGIDLPIFNWNRGNIKAADLAVKKKENESNAVRETIGEEVSSAYAIYQDKLTDWNTFNQQAIQIIDESQQVIEQAHLHQTIMPDEVLEIERIIVDTREMLAEKHYELTVALIDLCNAMGLEDYTVFNQ
jgi:outer membrane protein TolC